METNFNYFVDKFNKTLDKKNKINSFKSIKDYIPILKDITSIKTIHMNNHHIYDKNYKDKQLTEEIFNNNSMIIVESTTGTGKTSNVALYCKKYEIFDDNKINREMNKILSIVSRVSLASQHIESFNEQGINMLSYLDDVNVEDNNLVICINSLLRFHKYEPFNKLLCVKCRVNVFISSM